MTLRSPLSNVMSNPLGDFLPSDLVGLKLWARYNKGVRVSGSGVSQWNDASGNENHLKQSIDASRPSKENDGSILFDGVDDFLKADPFTLTQPETVYLLGNALSWTVSDRFFDGNTAQTGAMVQTASTPQISLNAGAWMGNNTDSVIGEYSIFTAVFNGVSSLDQIDHNAPVTGDAGINSMSGFTLGASGIDTSWSNIKVKEVVIFNTAHDAATRRKVINYLLRL